MKTFENINILIKVKLLFENVFLEKLLFEKKKFFRKNLKIVCLKKKMIFFKEKFFRKKKIWKKSLEK